MNLERLYLDYNATSPLSKSVLNWLQSGDLLFANPASQHSDGKASRKIINESRRNLFETFGLSEKEYKLFFHSGATEGIHTFAHALSEAARISKRKLLICYSRVDHPAVLSLKERFFGDWVSFFELKRDKNLRYSHSENLKGLKELKRADPGLLILYHHLWVHNETGQISKLEDLKSFKEIPDLTLHIDAVQTPGKILDWNKLSVGDIWTYSAHKFGSLKGIGFSFFKNDISFHPLISGGAQQGNLRSGTENVQGIHSILLALSDLKKIDINKSISIREKLKKYLTDELKDLGVLIDDESSASNTLYFYLKNYSSDISLALFDIHGIEISAGSACSSGAARDSEVLLQLGLKEVAKNGLRISMALEADQEYLNQIVSRLSPVFNKLRQK